MTVGGSLRVLVTDPGDPAALAPLREISAFEIIERPGLRDDELSLALRTADAVVARTGTALSRETLGEPGRLKVIARPGVGIDNIDIDAASALGIAVVNAPRGNTISAAEHTLALLLALARALPAAERSIREGGWDRSRRGRELHGLTLGILGLGRIGREVAARARAFRMEVVGFDPLLADARARELGIEPAPLPDVIRRADALTLHVPLSPSTRGLIDQPRIGTLKRGALLVNASRGGVVNEADLLEALDSGQLGGAALDVFEHEPLPADHPLRFRPDTVVTPHIGAATGEAQRRVGREIADAMVRVLLHGDVSVALNAPYLLRRPGEGGPDLALAARLGRQAAEAAISPIRAIHVHAPAHGEALSAITAASAAGVLEAMLGPGSSNLADALSIMVDRGIPVHSEPAPISAGMPPPRIEVRVEL